MTTLDLLYERAAETAEPRMNLLARFGQIWSGFAQRRRARRTVIELSRLDAYLLRDIGIEPMDVYDALHGRKQSILLDPMRRNADE